MKNKKNSMVIVTVRLGVDLVTLASSNSPIKLPCGNAGPIIARDVLAGKGKALVKMSLIKTAIDTQDGVNAILDNFDLTDPETMSPLIFRLLSNFDS